MSGAARREGAGPPGPPGDGGPGRAGAAGGRTGATDRRSDGGGGRVTVVLPDRLRGPGATDGRIELRGCATVGDALGALGSAFPGVHDRIVTERGEVRPHLNLFVGRRDVRWTGGLETPLADGDEVLVLRSVSGG